MKTNKLLDQDRVWITQDQMPLMLEEMDSEHRRNTLAFLRRRATYLMKAYFWCEIRDLERFGAPPDGCDDIAELYDNPVEWLERRPLIQALARLVRNDDAIDAEVVGIAPEPSELAS